MDNSRVVVYKPMIEICKAKEGSYILDFGEGWPGSNAVEFYWVYGELTEFHDHSEVFNFRNIKLTFLELQVKVELSHVLKNTMGSFSMHFGIGGGNEEVVYIDDEPSLSNHVLE